MPCRVAGADPGTSSLDLLILHDGAVAEQCRFEPTQLQSDPTVPARWLAERGPFDLIAGPSGYGLPLRHARNCTEQDLALMALVRPDDGGRGLAVTGFRSVLRALAAVPLPVVFLPGVIHLPTVPAHRKINRIDLGTADKLCVAALALEQQARQFGVAYDRCTFCLIELGSAFTACVVVSGGRVVDGVGGTGGPCGWRSGGAWDGELAYLLSPLAKADLFAGGVSAISDRAAARNCLRESLVKAVAGLRAVTPFEHVILSGRLLATEPELLDVLMADLRQLGSVSRLESLPGAWVKHAAQGAALLADGLAGGTHAALVESLRLRDAAGTVIDWLCHPRAQDIRGAFM